MVESRWRVGRDPSGPTMPTVMVGEGLRVSSGRAGKRGVRQVLEPDWSPQTFNTELVIYALEQVHCWGTYFCARTGQFENFTHLNF
jgi:hypothetical protein